MTIAQTGLAQWLAGAAIALSVSVGAVQADDTLDRGIGGQWTTLDPHRNWDTSTGWILGDAYEGLVTFDATGNPIPGSAESWEVSADGLTYTFRLREGLKWSNGDPLVAQDFVNGALRVLEPNAGFGYYLTDSLGVKGAAEFAYAEVADSSGVGVTAPDDRTVVVELLAPNPQAIDLLGFFQLSPLHSSSFDANGESGYNDATLVVSNGAYKFKEIVSQSHVLLERNPNYWDAENVKIPFVKYHATEDVNTELLRYKTGDMDITYDIPIEQFATLKAELPGEVWVYPTAYVTFFSFRPSHPDLANIDIRRALTLALDRDLLENKIVRSGAMPTFSLAGGIDPEYMGPTIAEASMTQDEREALAQELYAKAGYGPDNPLRLTMTLSAAEISLRRAQGAALMWKQVLGAEIDIKSMEGSAANETYYAKDWVMYVDNLISDYAGPEPLLAAMRPSPDNVYEWDKPEFNALMDEAVALTAKEDRLAALAKAERVLLDDYIIAPLAIEPSRRLVKPNVKGFAASPVLYHHSQWMTLE